MSSLNIAINGAGIGGLTAAIALRQAGHQVTVFEQSKAFLRVGADINLTPNAVRALDGLGIGAAVRVPAARPTHRISRLWDSGEETSRLEMADAAESQYGAPQLTIHRADLLAALAEVFPLQNVQFGKRAEQVQQDASGVELHFKDGSQHRADLLIGADGIHSVVRNALFGKEQPRFTGVVAYRAVVPASRVAHVPNIQAFTKWWGPNPQSQIVTFPLNQGRDIFIFATTAQDSWHLESWTTAGDAAELRSHYQDFHPDARALLDACGEVLKTALYERDPLPYWSQGAITLLGDACHPMMPFMAQGAGQAIEDAVVLARHLHGVTDASQIARALQGYQQARLERTSQIQIGSRGNQWLKAGGNADWVYGYDAWTVPTTHAA
ncbi:FAD-dependent monooxygenase [Pseudomonas auratipiscis]|uniref:FAD-dependent monooxygenase n=1 Tax=Pseudomonas auratipiscis TaxID=3115853 RepID=A0AB35WSZ6_9PSED|nr:MULTISPECIES: FAD-dependent monooxygenase [unclassified Pseudomonas]MEE1867300.1 FAD-dependent monooxygenase [Pseudomonas sp. 120P]MEE1958127.1 FAD-dependent monooxygenase [Pseudomonas sp. 119P]